MRLLVGQDEIVRAWVAQKIGMPMTEGHAFGVWSDEQRRLVGGFVFTNYTGYGIEMTMAGKGCFSRSIWRAIGEFVYGRMGCVRLVITTRRAHRKRGNPVAKMAHRFGFKFEGVARRFYGDRDGMQWSLLKEEAMLRGYFKDPAAYQQRAA